MTALEHKAPTDRLNYAGDLTSVIDDICTTYNLGTPKDFSVIEVGYEDCNVIINTDHDRFLAKMFADFRTSEDIKRYVTTIQKVLEAGVNHPELIKTPNDEAAYATHGIKLVLLKFVAGKTFYDLNRAPNEEERRAIIEQAAIVNRIDYRPHYLLDSWAIPNIRSMHDRVKQLLEPEDLALVEQVVTRYEAIPADNLPHAFVHGDIIKTNVLKGDDDKVYILDFSVANWYPRIQELAVMASSLLHDEGGFDLKKRCDIVADEYSQFDPLTEAEKQHLPAYALAGVAMELMGAHQEKFINGIDNEENEYWLRLGREGLRRAFSGEGLS
jgi:Ser/Thr protein kinase RdoA (MazF antagonist)